MKRPKSIKKPCRGGLFGSTVRFCVIFGSRPGSRNRPPGASDVEKRLRAQTRFFEERPLGASVPSRTPFSMNFGSPGSLLDNFLKLFSMIFRWNSESSCLLFSALSPCRFLSYSLCLGIFPNGFPEIFWFICFFSMVFPSSFPQ